MNIYICEAKNVNERCKYICRRVDGKYIIINTANTTSKLTEAKSQIKNMRPKENIMFVPIRTEADNIYREFSYGAGQGGKI